jgi:lysyl-tRNA synthetase class 2
VGRDYPPFRGTRVAIADAPRAPQGRVAGRLVELDDRAVLVDGSGRLPLTALAGEPASPGDWISGMLGAFAGEGFRLEDVVVHAPSGGPSPDAGLPAKLPVLERRAAIVRAAREFFRERGFLEVETPSRVVCPGLEPHLVPFPAGGGRWLITSPELHLKRLVAAGAERVVEFARAFRDDERGRWHRPEFTLLEWYRAFAPLAAIEDDCERLLASCAAAAGATHAATAELTPPFDRTTVRDALRTHTGLDLAGLGDRDSLGRALVERGHPVHDDDTWDERFLRVWTAAVEPRLGERRPVFVHDYPASQAALARTRRESWGEVAERFELYVAGVEVANAFHELTDPVEQRRRDLADREARRRTGALLPPLDEAFLAALSSGMPPASGIALGLDRLVALLVGAAGLDEITAFP